MKKQFLLFSLIGITICLIITESTSAQHLIGKKQQVQFGGPNIINFRQLAKYELEHAKPVRRKRFIEQGEDREKKFKFKPGPIKGNAHNFNVNLPGGYPIDSPVPGTVFNGTQTDGTLIPPDINGAAGINYVLETTNQQFDIYNKDGTLNTTLQITNFFSSTPGSSYFDPHVKYDAAHNRFIILSDGYMTNGDGGLFIGVSQTSDPTGNWYIYSTDDGVNNGVTLLDYDLFGYNNKWIVVTANLFGASTGAEVFVFNRSDFYNGINSPVTTFTDQNAFSLCPAQTIDTTVATEYLVMDYAGDSANYGYVQTFTITGSVNSPVLSDGFIIGVNQPWSETFSGAPQLGVTNTLEDGDTRISNSVLINGSLWFTHTVTLPVNAPTHDAVDWWQINPATPAVQQFGRIEDPDGIIYYYYPSINVNNAGNVLVGYTTSSPNIYASAEYSFRASTDPLNTLQSGYIFKNGLAYYYQTFGSGRNRWGDFSGTCVDPVDNSFWTLQEFAAIPANSWGTVIANIGGVPCTGKPTAGTATVSSAVVCPGTGTVITLSGNTIGIIGIRFLWQQSFNGKTGWATAAGNDSTTQYVTSALNAPAYFRCVVSCTASGMSDTTTMVEVTVNGIYSSTNDTICSTGIHKIAAQGGGEINWYLNKTAPSTLATGDTLTANISGDTTFYLTSGAITYYKVAPVDNTIGTGAYFTYFTRGLVFTALSNFTLDTVFIYPGSAGNLQVNLINALTGIVLDSVIVAIPNSAVGNKTPIPLNMNIAGGTVYDIDANNSTLTSIYRNDAGAVYPYTVPGVVSITNNILDVAGYYYFFYDWRLHSGCVSARIPVNVDVAPIVVTAKASTDTTCSGSSVTLTATGGNTYKWLPGNLTGSSVSVSPLAGTTYTVTGTVVNGCTASASVAVDVISALKPSVTISTPNTTICTGTGVVFTASPTNGGVAPSYQWKVNGNNAGTGGNTFISNTLSNGDQVSCVLTSDISCASPSTTTSNTITMTVNPFVTPTVTINTPNTTICAGTSVIFTAMPTNGGGTPAYQWKNNGVTIAGATTSTYTTSTLANGNVITVVLTSDAQCTTTTTVTSNSETMTVNPMITPSVTINTPNTTICAGTSVIFTATPTNGGTTPVYQWKNNGATIAGATASTYTTSSLANGNVITVVLTSDAQCVTTTTATSNSITMEVNPLVTPTVTINTSNTTICAGTSVMFTATPTNGGTTPAYQWKNNGATVVGATTSTYTTSTLANGNVITVVLTSDAQCATTNTATSNSITMMVNLLVTPTVTITTSGTTICAGTSVMFTATPTNGGTTPAYQWKNNGATVVGATISTYTTSTLANGNVITVALTSDAQCATTATATSNSITMAVNPLVTPSVTINTASTTICAGTSVMFTATPTNGGTTPAYQWKNNGTNITGATAATYTTSALANGNVITVVLTSDAQCSTATMATSNSKTMTVNPLVTPSLTINTPSTTICAGTSVTFTAIPTNGGVTPAYQWKVNGSDVGTNSNTLSFASLANGSIVSCVLTSNLSCVTSTTAASNSDTMAVSILFTPNVSINTTAAIICAGTNVTFTATSTNGGITPAYQWEVNGSGIGANSNIFSSASLANGDVISCVLTSDLNCVTKPTAGSNSDTMTVNSIPVTPTALANSPLCEGNILQLTTPPVSNGGYSWTGSNSFVSTMQNPVINNVSINDSGIYQVEIIVNGCTSSPGVVSVVINPTPSIPVITQTDNVLTSSSATGNQWYLNHNPISGANGQTDTVNQTGWYTVVVTNSDNCSSTSDSLYFIITSVEQFSLDNSIKIIPDPFSIEFDINISNNADGLNLWNINITDELGRIVYTNRNVQHDNVVDLEDKASGVYFVNILTGNGAKTLKVIKQ